MKRHLTIAAAAIALLGPALPSFADEVITSESSHTSSTTTVEGGGTKKFAPKFKERLNNLKEQIEMGVTKGWINAEEAAGFRKEHERVDAEEASVKKNNWVKAEVDQLEKDVTALNQKISTALTKGSEPKKDAAKTEAAGESKDTKAAKPAAKDKTTKTTKKSK